VLPYSIQPFIFTDFAMIGENAKPLVLDEENRYWAPGLGARWESPIGSMRFALGHGFISGPKGDELDHQEQWQFYFSFGDTF
jgi:outer membrane protein assembly factor BamA